MSKLCLVSPLIFLHTRISDIIQERIQDALAKKGVVSSLSVLCRDPWSWAVSLCYALPSSSALVFQEVIFAEREALGAGSADECRRE